jgi:hypothetical protein
MRFVSVQYDAQYQEFKPLRRNPSQGDGLTYLIADLATDDFLPVHRPEPEPEPELVEAARGR